jgi:hypothetical protein
MTSTTTNYGWTVPTSSDLVKNGATAISTVGQAVDTFMFRPFTRNGVLNGSLNVWQRGTSIASSATVAVYTADRWKFLRAGYAAGATVSRQATSDTTNLPFIQYAARVQRDSGNTNTTGIYLYQNFETINSIPYAGKQVTMSFYARSGANYSSASSVLNVQLISGTGTDQDALLSYTASANVISSTATLTTTWQRFTYTATVGATATELGTNFYYTPVGTAGANDYFEVTGVMLEVGSQASPYAPCTPTYETELAACQRYYYKISAASNAATFFVSTFNTGTTGWYGLCPFPVTMRTKPSLETTATASNYRIYSSAGFIACSTLPVIDQNNEANATVYGSVTAGLIVGGGSILAANSTTSAYLGFTAEL